MKRILTILAVCVGGLVMADSANAQGFGVRYSTPIGNNGRLSIGLGNTYGGYYGNGYGFARPVYGYPAYGYPSYGYGFSRPVYGYPAYNRGFYGRPYGGGWRR